MGCIACGSTLQEDSFTIWTFDIFSTSLNPYVFKTIETDNGDFLPIAKRRNTGTKSNGVVKLVTLIVSFLICLQGSMYHRGSPSGCYGAKSWMVPSYLLLGGKYLCVVRIRRQEIGRWDRRGNSWQGSKTRPYNGWPSQIFAVEAPLYFVILLGCQKLEYDWLLLILIYCTFTMNPVCLSMLRFY